MAATLLCIHRDPAQLRVLHENGYQLLTAINGHQGLRLFRSQPVDAIVLEYNLGLLDGSVIASEIKQMRPKIPIVMLAEHAELPEGALQSVDVLVSTSDPSHFLWAAVHFLLTVKPAQHRGKKIKEQFRANLYRPANSGRGKRMPGKVSPLSTGELQTNDSPFSPHIWKSIRNGTVQF
jgi:DNA-binding response OmpR family regulator